MKRLKNSNLASSPSLCDIKRVEVRFSETDAMGIVWHGNYAKFFEDGRESFGKRYGIDYMTIYKSGYTAPIVEMNCNYKSSLTFGDEIIVETHYIPCEAAKLIFEYIIRRSDSNAVVATGRTVQVFLKEGELELLNPPFFAAWKEANGIK